MAGRFGGKRVAVGAAVAAAAVIAAWVSRGDEARARRARIAHDGSTEPRAGASRWIPWLGGGTPDSAGIADDYDGPLVPVHVHVVDLAGAPVRGAAVEAWVDPHEWEFAGLEDEEYDEKLRETFGGGEAARAGERASASDRDDDWDSDGWEDDWPAPAEDAGEDDGEDGGDGPLEVLRGPSKRAVLSGRTGRDGVFTAEIKPGVDVVFHARDGDGREGVSPFVFVYARDAGEEGGAFALEDPYVNGDSFDVRIELAALGILTGEVRDAHGEPVEGARVEISPWQGDHDGEDLVADKNASPRTRADGTFRVRLRASGAFDVEVRADGYQPAIERAAQVLPGRETRLHLTMLDSEEIAGVVLDPRGEPLPDARVMLQGEPRPGEYVSTETITDASGRFRLEELAPGAYTLGAAAPGFRPVELWDVRSGQEDVTLRLAAGGRIVGTVTASPEVLADAWTGGDFDERIESEPNTIHRGDVYLALDGPSPEPEGTHPGIPVAAGVPPGRENESPSGTLDWRGRYMAPLALHEQTRSGTFEVGGLPPGTYAITVMLGPSVVRRGGVRVWEGGTAQVSFELPDRATASVAGRVRTHDGLPLPGASVFLYGSMPSGLTTFADASGRFEFRSVPAGEYLVHATPAPPRPDENSARIAVFVPTATVRVPSGGRVEVDLVARAPAERTARELELEAGEDDPEDPGLVARGELGLSDPDREWMPDIWIEVIDDALVVTRPPPAGASPRLFGGDRVTSIDGTGPDTNPFQALDRLYGSQGTMCAISVTRPATAETVTVTLPRDKNSFEMGNDW